MITRISHDRFHIHTIGGEIDRVVRYFDLEGLLDATECWSYSEATRVLLMPVGASTPRPEGRWTTHEVAENR